MSAHIFIFAGFSPHPKKKHPSLDFWKIVPIVLAIPHSGVLCGTSDPDVHEKGG